MAHTVLEAEMRERYRSSPVPQSLFKMLSDWSTTEPLDESSR